MVPASARFIERAPQFRLGGLAAAAFDPKLGGEILAHPLPLDFGVHRCIVFNTASRACSAAASCWRASSNREWGPLRRRRSPCRVTGDG
ncbi:hypothetical protein ABT299_52070 [Spirillospora sp. NPDC000708]